jgi:FkbM family methyltransferase
MNVFSKIVSALGHVAGHPINRNRKLRAVMEYGFIQIAARMVPGEVCVKWPNGTRLMVPPSMKGAAHFITPVIGEFEHMAFVMHLLRPGDTFCDVGANIGAFTVLAAGVAGAKVVAFEPSPETFEMLQTNVRLNNLASRVRTVKDIVGRQTGTAQFSSGLGTENHVAQSGERNSIAVPVVTLDQELAQTPATLLKVDVEGFEAEVFAGARKTLRDTALQAVIVERDGCGNRYGYDESALHAEIRSCGFSPQRYMPFGRTLQPLRDSDLGLIIYVRNADATQERLRAAPKFEVGDLKL